MQNGGAGDACPIPPEHRQRPVYNVYNQRIDDKAAGLQQSYSAILDPKNNMPAVANQQPAPGQRDVLSTHRQRSNIPKGGTDTTWLYPSPQMFYNGAPLLTCIRSGILPPARPQRAVLCAALNRKGKSDGINDEDDVGNVMSSVVATHNGMNEMTWDRVMLWERLHPESTSTARLNRFEGRPHDLSPLARLRALRGLTAPFDRHDWYVLREDDREVRYVIDFYFNEDRAGHSDVRPSLRARRASAARQNVLARMSVHWVRAGTT